MDILSAVERSERMSRIRAKNTKPELIVRRLLHAMNYRYRLHSLRLPGKPDLVFKGRKKIIFVHGCLWHGHEGCRLNRPPKTRLEYWAPKLNGNKQRDTKNQAKLQEMGWEVLVVWECEAEARDHTSLSLRLREFLGPTTTRQGTGQAH